MTGVILQGQALKVVNRGGGYITKTEVREEKLPGGKVVRSHKHLQSGEKAKGSDYIVFKCPGCGARNKRCAYEVKGSAGSALSFKCNKCYREIEVAPPRPDKVIITGSEVLGQSSLLGPDGRPI